jgi:hypothetical protein
MVPERGSVRVADEVSRAPTNTEAVKRTPVRAPSGFTSATLLAELQTVVEPTTAPLPLPEGTPGLGSGNWFQLVPVTCAAALYPHPAPGGAIPIISGALLLFVLKLKETKTGFVSALRAEGKEEQVVRKAKHAKYSFFIKIFIEGVIVRK